MCWQRCRRCKSHSQICLCFPAWLFPPFTFLLLLCHRNINNGALFPKFWSLSVTSSIVMNRFQMLNFTYNLYCSEVTYIFHHWPRVAISKHCACFLLRLKWATNERVLQYSTHQEEGHKQQCQQICIHAKLQPPCVFRYTTY